MTTETMVKRKCPRCKSKRIWKKGFAPTQKGCQQRYVCYKCGHTFFLDDDPVITHKEYEKRVKHPYTFYQDN